MSEINYSTFINKKIHSARMAKDVQSVISNGPRFAGTLNEWKAAEYISGELKKIGIEVLIDQIEGVNSWKLKDTRVSITSPVYRELNGVAILGSGGTPPDGITAEIVHIGRGRHEDIINLDVKNKFVFRDPHVHYL